MPVRDAAGKTISSQRQSVDRNAWDVVQFSRLYDEAKALVRDGVHRQDNCGAQRVEPTGTVTEEIC